MSNRIKIKPDEKVPITLTEKARQQILDLVFHSDPAIPKLLRATPIKDGRFVVEMTLDDIDLLHGDIAAEASRATSKIQRSLDSLCARLRREMEKYDDGNWQSNF